MTGPTARLDWSGKHGPVWAAINITLALVATAAVTHYVSIPGTYMALAAAGVLLVAVVTAFSVLVLRDSLPGAALAGLLLLAGGAWVLVGRVSPHDPTTLGVVAIGGTLAAIVGRLWRRRTSREGLATAKAAAIQAARQFVSAKALEWERRISRVCKIEGRVTQVDDWPNGTGFDLRFVPQEGGTTTRDIMTASARLAADAKLPVGCGVEVVDGDHRGEMLLRVATVNALKVERPYPTSLAPRSINDPQRVGVNRDASVSTINLRFHSLAMVGEVGSGKSNRLHVVASELAQCSDVLTWMIDFTGSLFTPWITPWLEGRAAAPGVDWVASTPEEAYAMTQSLIAVIDGRKPAYRRRMRAANDDKLPVGSDVPQIILIVDEFRKTSREVQHDIATISDTGRGAGVRTVVCALRATTDYLPPEIKAQAANRIGQRMTSEAEIAYLLGWDQGLKPADAPYAGNGFVVSADDRRGARPDLAYRQTPEGVDDVVVRTAGWRPAMDAVSVKLADKGAAVYSGRWDRYDEQQARLAEADGILERGRARVADAIDGAGAKRATGAAFESRGSALNATAAFDLADVKAWPAPKNIPYQRSPAHERVLALLAEAAPNGLQPQAIMARLAEEGFATERQTLQKWLSMETSRGTVRQPVERGPYYALIEETVDAS